MLNLKKIITPTIILLISIVFAYFVGQNSRLWLGYPIVWFIVAGALILQIIVFIPALIFNTQKFFDLTGSITFLSATAVATLSNSQISFNQLIASLMVVLWAGRLGTFLFVRVLKAGKDSRFTVIKQDKLRFMYVWIIQGIWVVLTMGPLLAVMTSATIWTQNSFKLIEFVGIGIWMIGFGVQIVADQQKSCFRVKIQNKQKFINSGLWKYSRHPNYVGEIILWTGATIFSYSSLEGGQLLTLICPIFVYLLLSKVSGVPLLEQKADQKWGKLQQYCLYRDSTPVLFPYLKTTSTKKQ